MTTDAEIAAAVTPYDDLMPRMHQWLAGIESDGRLADWPGMGLRALGAARVTVIEGEGLDLIPPATAAREERR